jgi:hypothetical protein
VSRTVPLTVINGGISRLRTKGGARADTLYDLRDGYVTEAGTVLARPGGTRAATLPSTTRGLVYFDGLFHTFSHQTETVPTGYRSHIITHPTDNTLTLSEIHFAKPYLGFLYVVAEFSDGSVKHFWLANSGVWQAKKAYKAGDVVIASTDTGLLYRATRAGPPYPSWTPNTPRAVNDIIEPTTYNGYYYTVVSVVGSNPRSGATEPTWPTESGATVYEEADNGTSGSVTSPVTEPPTTDVPTEVEERYD